LIGAASARARENYRERLYRHYLADHRGADLRQASESLQGAYPYFRKLVKCLPENKDARILEIGCGYGVWLHWLKQRGYRRLEGIDRSPEQVEAAHSLGLDCVKQGDIQAHLADCEPASHDVVLAFDVLEHLGKEEALELADQVFRALRPGGMFILHLPNGEGFLSGSIIYGDFTHELILNRRSLGQLLRCAGFSEVSTYEDTPVVQGPRSMARYVVWKAARGVLRLVYAAQTGSTDRRLILSQNFLAIAHKNPSASAGAS